MLLVVAMLTTLVDAVVTAPKGHWQSVAFETTRPRASVDISFQIPDHVSRIQIAVISSFDEERFQHGRTYRPVCASGYQRSVRLRCVLPEAGKYTVLIDNRLDTRFDARVHLKVESVDAVASAARTLPPQRRMIVITVSILLFLGVVAYSARQLMR